MARFLRGLNLSVINKTLDYFESQNPKTNEIVESEIKLKKKQSELFSETLVRLGVEKNFRQKQITRDDIYSIQLECETSENRPLVFLRKLLALNYQCRNSNEIQSDYTECKNSEEKRRFSNEELSSADLVLCTLSICDSFLIQDVFEKMSLCQLAVPIIAPIYDKLLFYLWASRTISKKWVQHCTDQGNIPHEKLISDKKMSTISFCRFGELNVSKSKIVNAFLSTAQGRPEHSYFLQRDIDSESKLSKGSVEAVWYCPENRSGEKITDITSVYNLRGDAAEFILQFQYLTTVSSTLIIFLDSKILGKDAIGLLKNSKCKVIFVDFGKNDIEQIKGEEYSLISAKGKNIKAISSAIVSSLVTDHDIAFTLEEHGSVASELNIEIDEQLNPNCMIGKFAALKFVKDLYLYVPEKLKEKVVPLQGFYWLEWSKLDKEEARLQYKGTTDTQTYSDSLRTRKKGFRKGQKQQGPSKEMLYFMEEIAKVKTRSYFLQWVQMELNKRSEICLPPILKDYLQEKDRLSKLIKQHGESNDIVKKAQNKVKKLSDQMLKNSFGIEHMFRELGQIYESNEGEKLNLNKLPMVMAELFLLGQSFELMDGDASHIPLDWVNAFFTELGKLIGKDKRVFVLSVLGIQSSGKSTLLNTLFGCKFAVSSGRCTKGVYLQLLSVKEEFRHKLRCDFFIIMDSEGLRSPELTGTIRHDNEIATLVACLANTTVVNFWGQTFSKDMADIMQIVAHAYIRMKSVKIKSSFHLVFAGVVDVTAEEKNRLGVTTIVDNLNEMIIRAAKSEGMASSNIRLSSFFPLLSSNNKNLKFPEFFPTLWQGSMSPPELRYGEIAQQLKFALSKGLMIDQNEIIKAQTFSEFLNRIKDLWEAIKLENFIFGFKNTQEVEIYAKLQHFYDKEVGAVRTNLFQISWKIGEESIQEVKHSMDATRGFSEYCSKIGSHLLPKITDWQESFREKFIQASEESADPEVSSKYLSSFCLDLEKKIERWLERERVEIKYKLEIVCQQQTGTDIKKEEYQKKCIKQARTTAKEIKTHQQNLDDVTLMHEFDKMFSLWKDEANKSDIELNKKIQNLFMKMWTESQQHIETKLQSYLAKSSKEIHEELESCQKIVRGENRDSVLFHAPLFQNQDLEGKVFFYNLIKLQNLSKWQNGLNLIIQKLQGEIQECSKSNHNYFNWNAEIARILDIVAASLESLVIDNRKLTNQFQRKMLIRTFGILVNKMEKIEAQNLKQNSILLFLQNEKPYLQKQFITECKTVNDTILDAKRFSDDIIVPILVSQVKVSLGSKVSEEVLSGEYFIQKKSMNFFAMKTLLNAKFEDFIPYILDYNKYMNKFIREKTIEACLKYNFLGNVTKENIKSNMVKIKTTLENIQESHQWKFKNETFKSTFNDRTGWWSNFKVKLVDSGFIFQLQDRDVLERLTGIQDSNNFVKELLAITNSEDFLRNVCIEVIKSASGSREDLGNQPFEIQKEFIVHLLEWFVVKPVDVIVEQRMGCTAQCPICGAVCGGSVGCQTENARTMTNQKHRAEIHMPQGLNGYRFDAPHDPKLNERLNVDVCTSCVCSNGRFKIKHKLKKKYNIDHDNYVPFADANKIFFDWQIQPVPQANATAFWQFMFVKHQKDLANYFHAKESNRIPPGWYEVTEQEAVKNLRDTYGVDDKENAIEEQANESVCIVCKFRVKCQWRFLPCGHAETCQQCSNDLMLRRNRCPSCARSIESLEKRGALKADSDHRLESIKLNFERLLFSTH